MKEKLPCGHELEKIAYHCEPCCDEVSSKLESEQLLAKGYANALEATKADLAWTKAEAERQIKGLELQLSDMERRLSQQVNTRCTCGGSGPGEGCDWCNLYHYVKGTGFPDKRVGPACQCDFSPRNCPVEGHRP